MCYLRKDFFPWPLPNLDRRWKMPADFGWAGPRGHRRLSTLMIHSFSPLPEHSCFVCSAAYVFFFSSLLSVFWDLKQSQYFPVTAEMSMGSCGIKWCWGHVEAPLFLLFSNVVSPYCNGLKYLWQTFRLVTTRQRISACSRKIQSDFASVFCLLERHSKLYLCVAMLRRCCEP